jgi:hypothetical protein
MLLSFKILSNGHPKGWPLLWLNVTVFASIAQAATYHFEVDQSDSPKEPKFKWQDAVGLAGVLLAVAGMADLPLFFRISFFVCCAVCLPISFSSHKNWPIVVRWILSIAAVILLVFMALSVVNKASEENKPREHVPTAQENADATAKLLREQSSQNQKGPIPVAPASPTSNPNKTSSLTQHSKQNVEAPQFVAYSQPDAPYADGAILGGIVWKQNYVDARLDISTKQDIRNLDFFVALDTHIAGLGQISQFPGVTAFPAEDTPPWWGVGTDDKGKPVSIAVVPTPGMMQSAPIYRVHCSEIFPGTTVHLAIASIAINPPSERGELPHQLFAPRRAPKEIRIKGTYEVNGQKYDVSLIQQLPQQ